MHKNKVTIKEAVKFHGHLGPYLVLGLLMGELAIEKLGCRKHFGIEAVIKGALNKPKSCLIDGIQISTGCTYGKGNIRKLAGDKIEVLFRSLENNKGLKISLRESLVKRLNSLTGHMDSEELAKELYRQAPLRFLTLTEEIKKWPYPD